MTKAEKLQSILDSKDAIKQAILAKGVSCGDTLSDYPNRIAAITSKFVVPTGLKFQSSSSITQAVIDQMDFTQLTNAQYLFGGTTFGSDIEISLPKAMSIRGAFMNCMLTGSEINVTCPALYNSESYFGAFQNTIIPQITLSLTKNENPQDFNRVFYYSAAETINLICPDNKIQSWVDTFTNCGNLVNLHLETQIVADLDLSTCTQLSVDSLVGVIAKLVSGMNKTLTLGNTNLAKLTSGEKAVATAKGWTLA